MSRGVTMRKLIVVAVALVAVLVACSDDSDAPSTPDEPPAREQEPTDNDTSPSDDVTVVRRGDLRLVTLNILHGVACPEETDGCQGDDRFALFTRQVEAAACPDVVALQEINQDMYDRVVAAQPTLCGGAYTLVWHDDPGIDRELVLTTLPVEDDELVSLAGAQRSAYRVNLDSSLGPVQLIVTHLGANQRADGTGGIICRIDAQCPADICPSGTLMITCQVTQVRQLADEAAPEAITLIVGDYNLTVDSPQVRELLDDGFVDAYLEAGNPECDRATGVGCTSGREDADLSDLTNPASTETVRIDLVLVRAPDDCEPVFDVATDADADGVGTGLFAHEPAIDGPGGIVYPSDHTGVALDLSCA